MPIKRILFAALFLASASAHALPEDARQPIHISADSASRNENTGITLYQGDVELSQGSMKIIGEELELRQNDKGITTIIARGTLAHFQQRPTVDQEITHAFGKVLNYDIRTKELHIEGQAKVTQGSDSFSGTRIIYDMKKSTVKAFGDKKNQGQRVQMVIQPKVTPETDTPSSEASDPAQEATSQ